MTIKFHFPWSLYFRQLFAADTYVRFVNPFNFWREQKIEHLESCSELDLVEHLESCYQKKCPQFKTIDKPSKEGLQSEASPNKTYSYRGCASPRRNKCNSSKPILFDTFFIVQSMENLKYRGVEYQKPIIVGIYFDRTTLNSNSNELVDRRTDKKI